MRKIKQILEYLQSDDRFFNRVMPGGKWVKVFFIVLFCLAAVWGGLLFWIDPYMCWHRAIGVKQVYGNAHAMIPGLLRNDDYDTVLIGSSLSQNALLSDIDNMFQCRSVKATSAGTGPSDLEQYISHAAKHPGLNHIILELNLSSFGVDADAARWREYKYLFQDQLIPVPYLLSSDTFLAVFDVFITNLAGPDVKGATLQKDRNRMFGHKVYRSRFDFNKLAAEMRIRSIPLLPHDNKIMIRKLNDHVISQIQKNPNIRFDVFLPPVSVFAWDYTKEINTFDAQMEGRELAAEALLKCPNVTLHDCQSNESVICDLNIYCDILHYNPQTNAAILKMIREKTYVVHSVDTIRQNNVKLRELMEKHYPMYQAVMSSTSDKYAMPDEIRKKFPEFFPAKAK